MKALISNLLKFKQNRRILTDIPNENDKTYLEELFKSESQSMHGQYPIIWDSANNFHVKDRHGNKWIDFTSTIFLTNAGHGNKEIIKSIIKTAKKSLLHTYNYPTLERIKYLEFLIKNTPKEFEKAFLLSAGTEATEAALKLMRLNSFQNNKKRPGILCIKGNYHGRTMGAQLMNSNEAQKEWIGFRDPNIHFLPFPYEWTLADQNPRDFLEESLEKLLSDNKLDPKDDLCGVMLETFQGWGACFYPVDYVKALREFCDNNNLLLCFDEMQAGFGRTGKLFGYEHYGVKADLICCGKGSSSSLPLSMVLGSNKIMDLAPKGSMSSTHSANPISCSASHANLKYILDKKLVANSAKLGNLLHSKLNNIKKKYPKYISHIQGKGLLAALIFRDEEGRNLSELATKVCYVALKKGLLLVCTGRESIKIGPPLTITKEGLTEGINVLDESIETSIKLFKDVSNNL